MELFKSHLYELPLCKRYVNVGSRTEFSRKTKCLNIDGKGISVNYEREIQLDPRFIKKHEFLVKESHMFIEAEECGTAIYRFFHECEGAKIGGDSTSLKALWIDPKRPIIEFPTCVFMRKNNDDEFVCGELIGNGNIGEFGKCVIEGHKQRFYCTIESYRDNVYKNCKEYLKFADRIFGYKIVSQKQLSIELAPMQFIR